MTLIQSLILGIIQGITEFLPISSSGHLILAESFLKLQVQDLKGFDIAIHFGTLLAIFIYFWKDYLEMLKNLAKPKSNKLLMYLLIATIPAMIGGLTLGDYLDEQFRNPKSVAVSLIVVGLFFFLAEYIAARAKNIELNFKNTFLIGVAQACALIPGVSRSGATISTGLIQGIKREEAARFSFLLGSVAISAATILAIYKVTKGDFTLPATDILLTGIISSFISGYIAILFLMKFLKKHTLHGFGIYRIILGIIILFI